MTNDYLWDRTGPPDPDIVRLERLLSHLRPAADGPRVLMFPGRARHQSSRPSWPFIAAAASLAAVVVAMAGVSLRTGRSSASLDVTRLEGTATIASRPVVDRLELRAGTWLETNDQGRASIDIASVGRVEVDPDTRISLLSSRPGQHRLQLQRGTIHALIWAPPGQFVVETPSSTAVDLGCAYTLTVDEEGVGHVRVTSGWVGFEWRGRESFIPAGAVCTTRVGLGPGTPHFADTATAFNEALAVLDLPGGPAEARRVALDRVLADARPKDAMTLWHLVSRLAGPDRARVFDRLAELAPPPPGVTRAGVLAGHRIMLDDWWDTLGLGAANWWRVWKQQWRDSPGR
ncbi:MAG TPA: FecR domain-containing protein [Vicinamibacterales bacterium]|nr:FecR domain-containing protein [Vicinamibacterales bacterium]